MPNAIALLKLCSCKQVVISQIHTTGSASVALVSPTNRLQFHLLPLVVPILHTSPLIAQFLFPLSFLEVLSRLSKKHSCSVQTLYCSVLVLVELFTLSKALLSHHFCSFLALDSEFFNGTAGLQRIPDLLKQCPQGWLCAHGKGP